MKKITPDILFMVPMRGTDTKRLKTQKLRKMSIIDSKNQKTQKMINMSIRIRYVS